jgi:hypothetical protein
MGNRGHDLIVVGLTTTSGELYLIQQYVIKFVSDLQQVSDFVQCINPIYSAKPEYYSLF